MATTSLVTVAVLRVLLKKTTEELPDSDPYATLILEQASDAVRDAARQPLWTYTAPPAPTPEGEIAVPRSAAHIAAWLAFRVYTNPQNLQRKTTGPISHTFFDTGLVGMELTDSERDTLEDLRPNSDESSGLWIQPINAGDTVSTAIFLWDEAIPPGDAILYADPIDAGAFGA